jgi:Clostripain family
MEDSMPEDSASSTPQRAKWTVMVFMGAATIAGNEPLIDAAEADLAEMQFVGSGGALNIFVQVHRGSDVVPRRGRITNRMPARIDALAAVPEAEADPVRGQALESFIGWSLAKSGYKSSDLNHYTMLVLWGHAYDFAIGRALTSDGTIDALDFAELSRVLERLQARYASAGRKLDILGFDACDLATVEMACQLAPFANYLLGSQIGVPIPGWPYDRVLERLRKPFGRGMGPAELGSYIVRRFCESYTSDSRTVSLTMLDLDRAPRLAELTRFLALTLVSAMGDPDALERIASLFSQSQTVPGKPFVDVADLCCNLARSSGDKFVAEAATALGDFLMSPRPPRVGESSAGTVVPFVVEHGRNATQTARLNGISIYAPNVVPEKDFEAIRHRYDSFFFAQETLWNGLVHKLARLS